jgi:hypothetical protein
MGDDGCGDSSSQCEPDSEQDNGPDTSAAGPAAACPAPDGASLIVAELWPGVAAVLGGRTLVQHHIGQNSHRKPDDERFQPCRLP